MNTQQLPYVRGSDTSKAAAIRALPKAWTKRAQVLEFIRSYGASGVTDEQIHKYSRMPANTARPRRVELVRAGLVKDSKQRRRTTSGDWAVVWVVA